MSVATEWGMEQVEWTSGPWFPIEGDPSDEAVRIVLLDYGNAVVEERVHIFADPYVQVVECEDGNYITWFAPYFEADEPEASVLKRCVLRGYIVEALESR